MIAVFNITNRIENTSFEVADDSSYQLKVGNQSPIQIIENFTFNEGLIAWQPEGQVKHLKRSNNELGQEEQFVNLETNIDTSRSLITQSFNLASTQIPEFLSFRFYVLSQEELLGFDEPVFRVLINDQPKYEFHWSEMSRKSHNGGEEIEWQSAVVYIGDLDHLSSIEFEIQNTGDNQNFGQLYLDEVSTAQLIIDSQTPLTFTSNDSLVVKYAYQDGQELIQEEVPTNTNFFIDSAQTQILLKSRIKEGPMPEKNNLLWSIPSPSLESSIVTTKINQDQTLTLLIQEPLDISGNSVSSSEAFEVSEVTHTHEGQELFQNLTNLGSQTWIEASTNYQPLSLVTALTYEPVPLGSRWRIRKVSGLGNVSLPRFLTLGSI